MAISHVETQTAENAGGAGSVATVGFADSQVGDILLFMVAVNQTASEDIIDELRITGGTSTWDVLVEHHNGFDGSVQFVVATRVCTGAGTINGTIATTVASVSRKMALITRVFRGADTVAVFGNLNSGSGSGTPYSSGAASNTDTTNHWWVGGVGAENTHTIGADTNFDSAVSSIFSSGGGGATTKITVGSEYDTTPAASETYTGTLSVAGSPWRAFVGELLDVAAAVPRVPRSTPYPQLLAH